MNTNVPPVCTKCGGASAAPKVPEVTEAAITTISPDAINIDQLTDELLDDSNG